MYTYKKKKEKKKDKNFLIILFRQIDNSTKYMIGGLNCKNLEYEACNRQYS